MTTAAHAPAGAGSAAPESEEARGQAGFKRQGSASSQQYAEQRPSLHAAQLRKAWSTMQARATLAGFRADLIEGDDGRPMLIVSRWAVCRSFTSLTEAGAWCDQVAGEAAA
jgi:hypothetical protein